MPATRFVAASALLLLAACNRTPIDTTSPVVDHGTPTVADATANRVTVVAWGPRSTTQGQVPNPTADGSMGLWVKVASDSPLPRGTAIAFDGTIGKTYGHTDVFTTAIPAQLLAAPGKHAVELRVDGTAQSVPVGDFEIKPAH